MTAGASLIAIHSAGKQPFDKRNCGRLASVHETEPVMAERPSHNAIVEQLARRSYSAAELVEVCSISGDVLTNYLIKARINLCSTAPGRGKSRKFALLDIYMIALVNELTSLTGNLDYCARYIETLVFGDVFHPERSKTIYNLDKSIADLRTTYMDDIFTLKPILTDRSMMGHIILLSSHAVATRDYRLVSFQPNKDNPLNWIEISIQQKGYFLNITSVLQRVDNRIRSLVLGADQ